jgi:hypothetical protein
MYIKVNGLMIRLRVRVYILTKMVPNTQVSGLMISSMDMDFKSGRMGLSMRATLSRV